MSNRDNAQSGRNGEGVEKAVQQESAPAFYRAATGQHLDDGRIAK
jgi:hypothetical protein